MMRRLIISDPAKGPGLFEVDDEEVSDQESDETYSSLYSSEPYSSD